MSAIKLPVKVQMAIDDSRDAELVDAQGWFVAKRMSEEHAKQIAHALNLHDKLRNSARRFFNAQAVVDRFRITSCGKTLEVAEIEFMEAQLDLAEVLYRSENPTAT